MLCRLFKHHNDFKWKKFELQSCRSKVYNFRINFITIWIHMNLLYLSGGLKLMQVLGASGSPWPDDVMAAGHLLQPDRSTTTKHVVFNMLLKTATTNFLSSPGRRPASGRGCRSPVARKTGRWLQGLGCNFYFFQEYLCNMGCNHQEYKWNIF